MTHLKAKDKLNIKEYTKFVLNKFDIIYEDEDINNLIIEEMKGGMKL